MLNRETIAVIVTNIIGFFIVLAILKRYAWGPILGFLEDRRRQIADEFATIDRQKSDAEELKDEYVDKLSEIDALKRSRIQEGAAEAQKLAEAIKNDARKEAMEIREKSRDDALRELDKARVQLRDHMVDMTVTSAEKLIRKDLDDAKHRELINQFIEQMSKA